MLVFSRRGGESVRIGDDVTVTILDEPARQVRIGIDAPKEVPVHREEVYNRIRDGVRRDSETPPRPRAQPAAQ